jgi:DNA (cytosine-5)-methyltransferase 1
LAQVSAQPIPTSAARRPRSRKTGVPVIRAAEFFAGIGLVRLALERQGCQVVFANDIDQAKARMYRDQWPKDDHLAVEDIHKLSADDIPDCHLFTASFPCNDLSIAGKWEGLSGKESSAFWGLIHLLEEKGGRSPPIVMLENVVGFLMSHGGKDLEQALLALNGLGYAVDAFILNAKHWVPQSRARLFVIAGLEANGESDVTTATPSDTRPQALCDFINSHRDIRWSIRDLPSLPKLSTQLADIIENLSDDDPQWWDAARTAYFMGQMSPKHEVMAKLMLAGTRYSYATAFRRVRNGRSMAELRTDGIAGCLRTPRGGSGRQILFKAGRGKHAVRLLTPRECARLQGVPDSYPIQVPLNQALFGFGDAVCVPAIEWIVQNHIRPSITQMGLASTKADLFTGMP